MMTDFCLETAPIIRVMAIKAKSSANTVDRTSFYTSIPYTHCVYDTSA